MERHYERELEELRSSLIDMGELVDRQLRDAIGALLAGDPARAERVIARDVEVDLFDTTIDRRVQSIIALNQPVAIDLRLLMAALKINGQLERMGDIAVNIAERVVPLAGEQAFLDSTRIAEMAEISSIMVRDSLDAFLRQDPMVARRVLESDDVVDKLNAVIFRHLVEEMELSHERIRPAAHMLVLTRHLERLADHATNIAEDVIFLVEARLVKHHAQA